MLIEPYRLEIAISSHSFALKPAAGGAELLRCRPLYEDLGQDPRRRQLQDLLVLRWPAL